MMFENPVAQRLHDDHMAVRAVLERLNSALRSTRPSSLPDFSNLELRSALGEIATVIETEIREHFRLEDDDVFPRLADAGEGAIGTLLAEEHITILALCDQVVDLVARSRKGDLAVEDWAKLWRAATALIEDLLSHIDKEETGLVPQIEDLLDADECAEIIARSYAA